MHHYLCTPKMNCRNIWVTYALCTWLSVIQTVVGVPDESNLRFLFQHYPQNQHLIRSLGTNYEVVYPRQIRQGWKNGLSTRLPSQRNSMIHFPRTAIKIEARKHMFYLEMQLNANLLAPTLVQSLNLDGDTQILVNQGIENCYYHATVRNYSEAFAALHTCRGISGIIHIGKDIFLIHPIYGADSSVHYPHFLYHYFHADEDHKCGNDEVGESFRCHQQLLHMPDIKFDFPSGNKYIELALVLDKSLFEKYSSTPEDVISDAIQIVNGADLYYRSLNTSISVVYLELWAHKDQILIEPYISETLLNFQKYAAIKLRRISTDAIHMLTGSIFMNDKTGMALTDTICTLKAVGLSKVNNVYESHLSARIFAHMLGHNLGMYHDDLCCKCPNRLGCLMNNTFQSVGSYHFSTCSIEDYYRSLRKDHGACLFNMPMLRESTCGNGILEKGEECDCGTAEECFKSDSCCDSITCKFMKNAECSSGSCCKTCKLVGTNDICRPSKGECDIPEYCDGRKGQCPDDNYKKNGVPCKGGMGYCYMGDCPVLKEQCEDIWGQGAESSDSLCFERFNVQGTPNGNCGSDGKKGLLKCKTEDIRCGSLQCFQGHETPVSSKEVEHFAINTMQVKRRSYECKVISSFTGEKGFHSGLIADGTKCGYQKLCVNQSCISVRNVVIPGNCPTNSSLNLVCSGNGVCSNTNECHCEEGWTGPDCNEAQQVNNENTVKLADQVEKPYEKLDYKTTNIVARENMNGSNPAIAVVVASTFLGLILVTLVILIFHFRNRCVGAAQRQPTRHLSEAQKKRLKANRR